jgi:hypothetical protein
MEQNLECMREEDQMLIVRGERDSFSNLFVAKVIPSRHVEGRDATTRAVSWVQFEGRVDEHWW